MRRLLASVILALCIAPAAARGQAAPFDPSVYRVDAPAPSGFDRAAAQRITQAHLIRLIAIDTRNPPGNERRVAAYLDSVLKNIPGVEAHVREFGDGRANFVARLRATRPTKRALLIMGHMDVVGADTTKWATQPLTPTIRDGYLYGRGAIDDKGMLAASLTAVTMLATQRDQLTRDIIFLGTADEESGGGGVTRMVGPDYDLIKDAEFALNEGGRVRVAEGIIRTVNIQTTEKVAYNVVATAKGTSGHASVPLRDNTLAALARAVSRVHEWRAPVTLNETTRLYFSRLATIEKDPKMKAAMVAISAPQATEAAIRAAALVLSAEPLHNAVLRTAASLTLMNGGIRVNVIPSAGTANFNVRALPGDDIQAVVRAMARAGGEPQVTFALQGQAAESPPPSPVATDLFKAMESAAKTMAPRTTVIPFMSTGATDGAELRAKGIPTYGILPMPLPMEDELRMHGDNERVPVPALGWATEYLYRILRAVATDSRATSSQ